MIEQHKPSTSAPGSELEALYHAHGNAEPDNGLDRIIRARAEQALDQSRKRRPAPWIAGLATAGALVLAIGLVLQQSPSPTPLMMDAETAAPMADQEAAPALRSAPLSMQRAADIARAPAPAAEIMIDSAAFVVGSPEPPPGAVIVEIRALLAAGHTDQAQTLLDELLAREPALELPDDLGTLRVQADDAEPEAP